MQEKLETARRWIVARSYNPLRHALLFSMDLRVSRGLPPVLDTVGLQAISTVWTIWAARAYVIENFFNFPKVSYF